MLAREDERGHNGNVKTPFTALGDGSLVAVRMRFRLIRNALSRMAMISEGS